MQRRSPASYSGLVDSSSIDRLAPFAFASVRRWRRRVTCPGGLAPRAACPLARPLLSIVSIIAPLSIIAPRAPSRQRRQLTGLVATPFAKRAGSSTSTSWRRALEAPGPPGPGVPRGAPRPRAHAGAAFESLGRHRQLAAPQSNLSKGARPARAAIPCDSWSAALTMSSFFNLMVELVCECEKTIAIAAHAAPPPCPACRASSAESCERSLDSMHLTWRQVQTLSPAPVPDRCDQLRCLVMLSR